MHCCIHSVAHGKTTSVMQLCHAVCHGLGGTHSLLGSVASRNEKHACVNAACRWMSLGSGMVGGVNEACVAARCYIYLICAVAQPRFKVHLRGFVPLERETCVRKRGMSLEARYVERLTRMPPHKSVLDKIPTRAPCTTRVSSLPYSCVKECLAQSVNESTTGPTDIS